MVFDKDLFLICGGIVCRFAVKNGDLWGSSDKNSPSAKSKVGIFTPILRRGRFRGGESPSNLGRKRGMWWIWRVHNRKTARSVGESPEKNKKTAVQGRNLETNGNSHPRYHSGLRKKRHSGSKKPSASNAASACRPNRSSNDRLGSHKHPTSRYRLTPFAAL